MYTVTKLVKNLITNKIKDCGRIRAFCTHQEAREYTQFKADRICKRKNYYLKNLHTNATKRGNYLYAFTWNRL